MIQWIQRTSFFPEIILSGSLLVLGTLTDFLLQGWQGLLVGICYALSALFLRRYEYLSLILVALAAILLVILGLQPTFSGALVLLQTFFIATFGRRLWSLIYSGVVFVAAIATIAEASFRTELLSNIYGLAIFSNSGRWTAFVFISIAVTFSILLAWLSGTWLIVQHKERTLQRERTAIDEHQIRLAIDLAEQNERMGIARDLNLISSQQLSSSIAMVEGAKYAAKIQPEVALRTLEKLEVMLRETHGELHQQQDALSHGVSIAPAPPNIFDLDALMVQYREIGYNCTLNHQGAILSLLDSAELAIYRIVFDALGNVRKHAPLGTIVTVDLTWQEDGLQVLIKDNGTETLRKQVGSEAVGIYNVNNDLEALVTEVDGVGIRTMQERASLIGGSLEAKVVPGVGFTVNALIPDLSPLTKA